MKTTFYLLAIYVCLFISLLLSMGMCTHYRNSSHKVERDTLIIRDTIREVKNDTVQINGSSIYNLYAKKIKCKRNKI